MPFLTTERTPDCNFLLQRESARSRWASSLKALFGREKSAAPLHSPYLFRTPPEDRFAPAGKSFSLSLLLHASFFVFVLNLPVAFSAKAQQPERTFVETQAIYYRIPKLDPLKTPPRVALREIPAPSAARKPAQPARESEPALKPAPIFAGNLAIESRPLHPDNTRQTILQPHTPPELRIPLELKLPDIVMAPPAPKISLAITPADARPMERRSRSIASAAPTLPPPDAAQPQTPAPSASPPKLAMPDPSVARVAPAARRMETAVAPSSVQNAAAPAAALPEQNSGVSLPLPSFDAARIVRAARAKETASVPTASVANAPAPSAALPAESSQPNLPLPSFEAAKALRSARAKETASVPAASSGNAAAPSPSAAFAEQNSRVSLPMPSFDVARLSKTARPAETAAAPEVHASNRAPNTSAAPGAETFQLAMPSFDASKSRPRSEAKAGAPAAQPGSGLVVMSVDPAPPASEVALPPGNREAAFRIAPPSEKPGATGGAKSPGAPGKASTSAHDAEKNGGAKSGATNLSVEGAEGRFAGYGSFEPSLPAGMIFPVSPELSLRKNTMVVSSGPTGGGGLNVYGALQCEKIYSIFLSMPHENWAMQYCTKPEAAASPAQSPSLLIHLDRPLAPPDPETRFDYRRLPLPPDKLHKLIILKGVLREDGTLSGLEIYRGVQPEMDRVALAAFSRWKFKPATQGGRPVAVQILVGVPTDPLPQSAKPPKPPAASKPKAETPRRP